MDELYGDVLSLLPRLREAGRGEDARELLQALTDACNPREILDNLRAALAGLSRDGDPETDALMSRIETRIEQLWSELPTA